MRDVMIDIETLGTEPGCVILSIGAVQFDMDTGTLGDRFYEVIDLKSSQNWELEIEPKTLRWWMEQGEAARAVFNDPNAADLEDTLHRFTAWYPESAKAWASGIVFDIGILEHTMRVCGVQIPWKFWNVADHRTVRNLLPLTTRQNLTVEPATAHVAIDDAIAQALSLCAYMKYLDGYSAPALKAVPA